MTYTTEGFCLTLDDQGRLTSLRHNQQEMLCRAQPIFTLIALDETNERIPLQPTDGRWTEDCLQFSSTLSPGGKLPMTASLRIKTREDELAFDLQVCNHSCTYRIVECVFGVEGIVLPVNDETHLLYPHHAGEKILNPAMMLRSEKYQRFWRAYSRREGDEWVRECNYCGLCSMSFMYLEAPEFGLYLGSHDAEFPVTGLITKTGGDRTPYLSLGFRLHRLVAAGASGTFGTFVLSLSRKDWHDGARRYRKWIMPHLDVQENPAFLKEQAALNQCYNFRREDEIQNCFGDIPRMWEEGHKRGIDHMFIASWNRTGFDSFYPEYYPDMELGTALDFRRGIDYINAHGGFATLYVNARLSDLASNYHQRFLCRMQLENEKGIPYTETYGPHQFTLNCPSDEQWQHMLVDACDFAAESYHLKGIYLDQLASAEPFACYHPDHSHADIGDFNRGYVQILQELLQRLRARDPESYLMTENCGDIYAPYTWGNLTWNGTDYDEFYTLFRYTFPEFVQVNMCNDRSWEKDPDRREILFYKDIERCILMGNILWIGITSRYLGHPELQDHFDYLMQAAEFRKSIARQVTEGVYLDDEWVESLPEGGCASCFRVAEDEALLLIGNAALISGEVVFRLPFVPSAIEAFDERGVALPVTLSAAQLSLRLPASRLIRISLCRKGDSP